MRGLRQKQLEAAKKKEAQNRRQKAANVRMARKVMHARMSGAAAVDGQGSAADVHRQQLLYYRLTGVELTMPEQRRIPWVSMPSDEEAHYETEAEAQARVIEETMTITPEDRATLLQMYAEEPLQWRALPDDAKAKETCRMPSCAMCGLRDPEKAMEYKPGVTLAKLPAWAKLNAHESALRERLGTVQLIESLDRTSGEVKWYQADLRKVTSTYHHSL